nr:hypothetical protein B0A51_01619 [Rachicladosporium sp. CCFEE 5018]
MYKLKHACLGELDPRAHDITAKSVRSTDLKTKANGIHALIEIGHIDEHDSSVASAVRRHFQCDNVLDEGMLEILGTVDPELYVELAQIDYDGCDLLQWVEYFIMEAGRYCCCDRMSIVREKLGSGFEKEEG